MVVWPIWTRFQWNRDDQNHVEDELCVLKESVNLKRSFECLILLSWASFFPLFPCFAGLSQEKIAAFTQRLRAEPRYLLAQNVSTCIDPLEVCLHRQTVQDTVHTFQHTIPTEGKPVTNQKNSGMSDGSRKVPERPTGSSQTFAFFPHCASLTF